MANRRVSTRPRAFQLASPCVTPPFASFASWRREYVHARRRSEHLMFLRVESTYTHHRGVGMDTAGEELVVAFTCSPTTAPRTARRRRSGLPGAAGARLRCANIGRSLAHADHVAQLIA